jgi:hypothetical protein
MIILSEALTVERYCELFKEGCPEGLRPVTCPFCKSQELHKHGRYLRRLFSVRGEFTIPIYRFKCSNCKRSSSLWPPFVAKGSQIALDVHEHVLESRACGISLSEAALTSAIPGGPFSERTLGRWVRFWDERLKTFVAKIWHAVLTRLPNVALPQGGHKPKDEWGYLLPLWKRISPLSLLEYLSVAVAGSA